MSLYSILVNNCKQTVIFKFNLTKIVTFGKFEKKKIYYLY